MGYIAFARSFYGKKIVRIHDSNTEVTIGASGSGYDEWYRYPASFLIPEDDPQYSKEGNTANGAYGYMLNSRCWAYDVGLALLVFATSRDFDICLEMLNRMKEDQNDDGSWNFSYDIYIGKLFHDYVRTGAIGWIVWGACYAMIEMADAGMDVSRFKGMLEKAGKWLLSKQVTDVKDPRYGLITGGYGAYDNDYNYTAEEIEWCSIEHQCSSLQALEGLSLVLKTPKYRNAAELIRDQLFMKCYDRQEKRFYQGIHGGVPDKAWALDCTSWAGMMIFSVAPYEIARDCMITAKDAYLVTDKTIVQSAEKDYYNQRYSSSETFEGFKPYSDRTADYEGAPEIVWSEGTLGYACLALILGNEAEAKKYVDECIKLQNCNRSTGGVLYSSATFGMMPWEFHTWESVVSSAWLYLIINNHAVLFPRSLRRVHYMAKIKNIDDERPPSNE